MRTVCCHPCDPRWNESISDKIYKLNVKDYRGPIEVSLYKGIKDEIPYPYVIIYRGWDLAKEHPNYPDRKWSNQLVFPSIAIPWLIKTTFTPGHKDRFFKGTSHDYHKWGEEWLGVEYDNGHDRGDEEIFTIGGNRGAYYSTTNHYSGLDMQLNRLEFERTVSLVEMFLRDPDVQNAIEKYGDQQ